MTWPLGWAMGGVVVGVALQLQQTALWLWPLYAMPLLVTPLVWRWRRPLAWSLVGLLVGFSSTGLRASVFLADALDPALEGSTIAVVGRVASLPQVTSQGERFLFEIESAQLNGAEVALPPRLLLGWYGGAQPDDPRRPLAHRSPGLQAGDRWAFDVRLKRPHGPFNAHGFDRERWLWEQGVQATGNVRTGVRDPAPRLLQRTWRHPVDRLRQAIRDRITERVSDARSAGVLAALVVGDQAAIERDDWDLFRATGVAHLMSISGLHVTLFAWLATALVAALWRALGRQRPALLMRLPVARAAAWGGVGLALAYAVLAGWGVPAQRTVLMLAIVVALRLSARHWPWPAVWLSAMAAVLVLDPWAWLSAGFWLSFVAVAILFSAGRRAGDTPAQGVAWHTRLARAGTGLLREQGLMTLALAPLSLWLFGQVSVVGLVANLVAIPWVTLLVTPLALLGVLVPPFWDIAAGAMQWLSQGLALLAEGRWAVLYRPVPPVLLAVAAAGGAWMLVMRWPALWRVGGALLVLPAMLWTPARPAHGAFDVVALDVGQGSAVLVRTARHSLLVDTGPRWGADSDAGERIVLPQLRAWGEAPDTVVVTHRDSDHAGGSAALAAAWPQAQWLSSFDPDPARRCRAGQRWAWDGVQVEVLHPQAGHYRDDGTSDLSTNDMSCVLRIEAGGASAWLGGDLTATHEVRLSLARPDQRANLLLAPHHGSNTSSSPVLLNTLQPQWVVVQAGYRNRFNHPADAVLQRYAQRRIPWVQTPDCGAARWRSDQPGAMACERHERRRYWHHAGDTQKATAGPVLAILPTGEKRP